MDALALLWGVLTAAGGTVALTLIVAIALGINALALLFAGSAVVALEHFARSARRPVTIAVAGACWALLVGAGGGHWATFERAIGPERALLPSLGAGLAIAVPVVALAMALTGLALRFLSSLRLATGAIAALGLGYGLVVGGSGRLLFAASPVLVALLSGGLLLLRGSARDVRRLLWVLAATLAVGACVAGFLPGPELRVAGAGAVVLGALLAFVLLGLLPLAAAGFLEARRGAEWFIAVRYLIAKRRQTFISIITAICVVGIAAGVWLIITVLSVMNGFERTWRDEIIGNRAHFTIHSGLGPFDDYREVLEEVAASPDVIAASPYVDADGMVRGARGEIMAVRVRGVDPDRVGDVTDLREDLVQGTLEALAPAARDPDADPAILIGSQLAGALGVGVGDPILLISPFGGPQTPLGPAPRLQRFQVAGVFESSFFQYDEMFTYVNLPAAQDFKRTGDVVDGIEARTTDFYRSQRVATAVQEALGFPFYTRDWKEFFPAFFQALKSERIMMFVLLTMIMVVAAFSIVATLVMMIMEKSSDIAILKAMGAEDGSIERIFAIEGTLIGLVGTALGVLAGISVTARIEWIQRRIEDVVGIDTLPASVYQFSTLPAELDVAQIAIAVGVAMVLALGATLLPSRQGARIQPAEALRYE